mmetsp:Transcript_883/g.3072  ORF Transcript_883/g.3072 Transcript_883/m.3072 type:complete len:85 (+) Transcript_883:584-838(+)|eukprot:scaffold246069_cov32-Tisochrysis_lutea.AAC.2
MRVLRWSLELTLARLGTSCSPSTDQQPDFACTRSDAAKMRARLLVAPSDTINGQKLNAIGGAVTPRLMFLPSAQLGVVTALRSS